jgi:hypothetical protein
MKTPIFFCLTLAVCRLYAQDTSLFRHLPPDASSIYQFNLPVLTAKLSWQELSGRIPLPQPNTNNRELAAILREPERAGVDLQRSFYLTETDGTGRDTLHTLSLLVHLADSARWSAFLREQDPGIRLSVDKGGACCARRERMGAAWDSSLAVLTFVRADRAAAAVRHCLDMLRGYTDEGMGRDSLFRTAFADDADIHVWTRYGRLSGLLFRQLFHSEHTPSLPLLGEVGLRTVTEARFSRGRISIKSVTDVPRCLDSLYLRFTTRRTSANLLSSIPAGNILAVFDFHFEPAAIAGLLEGFQSRGRTEALLFDKGLSVETFVHAFKGDVLMLAISPPVLPPDTMAVHTTVSFATPRPSLYVVTGLRDETAFWSWTSRLKWLLPPADASGAGRVGVRNPLNKYLPAYIVRDSLLVMSTGPKRASAWWTPGGGIAATGMGAAGGGQGIRGAEILGEGQSVVSAGQSVGGARQSIGGAVQSVVDAESPLSLWLDLKAIAASLQQRSPEKNRGLLSILKAFDQFSFTAGRLNAAGQLENRLEVTMVDTSANSLRTLFDLLQ